MTIYLSYVHQYVFKLGFTIHNRIENNFPLNYYCLLCYVDACHNRGCDAKKYLARPTPQNVSIVVRKPTVQYCLKGCFEKDELTPNRKLNIHLENYFHHFKINAKLIIQKHSFSKTIIKLYSKKNYNINTKIK